MSYPWGSDSASEDDYGRRAAARFPTRAGAATARAAPYCLTGGAVNQTNTGKYALAVGDIEKFGLASIPKLLLTVRKLKKVFWAESNCR